MSARRSPRPAFVCVRCAVPALRYKSWCPACGAPLSLVTIEKARARGIPLPFSIVGAPDKVGRQRWRTGLAGFDRILSHEGGVVPAASVLVAACPGSGKTTLLLATGGHVARGRRRVAYCSSEQDVAALGGLAERLSVHQLSRLVPVAVASVEDVATVVRRVAPALVVVDSATEIAKRSHLQPQAVVAALHELAHATRTAVFATVHVNASGMVRGGPELEHATDAVVMLTGDPRRSTRRELAASKNRYGDTTQTAIIEHTAHGFVDVANVRPAIPKRALGVGAALAIVRAPDGTLAVVEVQVMLSASLSNPRRITAAGVSVERVRVLASVAEREGVIVAGDLVLRSYPETSSAPGLDAAIVAALVSAAQGRALPAGIAFAGEIGLDGGVRAGDVSPEDVAAHGLRMVGQPGQRLTDALDRAHLRAV